MPWLFCYRVVIQLDESGESTVNEYRLNETVMRGAAILLDMSCFTPLGITF